MRDDDNHVLLIDILFGLLTVGAGLSALIAVAAFATIPFAT